MPGGPGACSPRTSIPGAAWVHLPITMGYDRYPELLIDEKSALLERSRRSAAAGCSSRTIRSVALGTSRKDEKGRYSHRRRASASSTRARDCAS